MATNVDFSSAKGILQNLKEQLEALAPQSSSAADALADVNSALASVNQAWERGEVSVPMIGAFAEDQPR